MFTSFSGLAALAPFAWTHGFVHRHIGPYAAEMREMFTREGKARSGVTEIEVWRE